MGQLLTIAAILVIALAWWHELRSREVALRAGREACRRIEAQFLDETVALRRWRPCRSRSGAMTVCRSYEFDFTETGELRRRGIVRLKGTQLEEVALDLHNVSRPGGSSPY